MIIFIIIIILFIIISYLFCFVIWFSVLLTFSHLAGHTSSTRQPLLLLFSTLIPAARIEFKFKLYAPSPLKRKQLSFVKLAGGLLLLPVPPSLASVQASCLPSFLTPLSGYKSVYRHLFHCNFKKHPCIATLGCAFSSTHSVLCSSSFLPCNQSSI